MKPIVFLAAALLAVSATPQGYYHQEYNYKTSSSSYKNNELQHQTDDSGFYSKSGDLEGRTKPKIKSDSEHSEYINPKIREGYYDGNADLTSQRGQLTNGYGLTAGLGSSSNAYQVGSQYGQNQYSQGAGMSSADLYGQSAGGSYGTSHSQGSSSSQNSYSTTALTNVASQLRNDLQQQIRSALQAGQSQYANRIDVSQLEQELRRNLTAKLQHLLQEQYGHQTIRGGQSYSLVGGHVQSRPNYDQQELAQLQNRLENSLLQELRSEYSQKYSSQPAYNPNHRDYETTTYRSVYPNLNTIPTERSYPSYPGVKTSYPTRDRYQQQPYQTQDQYHQIQTSYNNRGSSVHYTPVANPLSITNIVSNVQRDLDNKLNFLLDETERKYFSENSGYSASNLDSVLEYLRQELRNNLSNTIDQEVRSQYGNQIQKDGYTYSLGSAGQTSQQHNYKQDDLENLRQQVENNLLTKLNRDFESARQRWVISKQQHQQQQHGYVSSGQSYNYGTDYYGNSQQNKATNNGYDVLVGGSQTDYEASRTHQGYGSSGNTAQIANLQSQLQSELGRQIQSAINQNRQYSNVHTAGYGSASFDEVYQKLYEEMQRNLTRQMQEFLQDSSHSSSSSSYGVSDAQLASLKNQLQSSLASQLQQGLRQSYSASASYSASSSGSSSSSSMGSGSGYSNSGGQYRVARGYESDTCCGYGRRKKRSYGGYRSRPLGLTTYGGTGASHGYGGYRPQSGAYASASSFATSSSASSDSDLNQQVEPLNPQQFVGQEMDNSDNTQQHMVGQEEMGQEELDLGQIEDSSERGNPINTNLGGFTSFQVGSQLKPSHSYAGAVSGQHQSRPWSNKPQITNFQSPDDSVEPALQTGSQIQGHPTQPQRGDQPPPSGQYPNEGPIENEPEGYGPVQSSRPFIIPLYTGKLRPISTLKISASQQVITEDIQLSLTNKIDQLLKDRVPGARKTTQVYRQLLEELQEIIGNNCKERLKNVSQTQYNTIEEFLQQNLYQKLIYELLERGFTKETLELYKGRPIPGRPFTRPEGNYDFIQGEINSGINQHAPRPLPNSPKFTNAQEEQAWLIDQLKKATTIKPLTESITGPFTNTYEQPTLDFIEKYIPGLSASQFETVRTLDVELHVYIVELLNKEVRLIEKQHLQPQDAYETVLHDLEEKIEEVIAGTLKGNKPELIKFNRLIKNQLPRKYLLQLEEYLSMTLNDSVTKHLKELYNINTVEYQPASYESLQNQISDLTVDQYQIVRQLDVELQKEILKLLNKQINLAKQQKRPAQEAFTTILHNLEEEIEVWVQDTLSNTKNELQRFSRPVNNKLTPKQLLELKEYLNNALTGSVAQQLSVIYNLPVPKPEVPTWYQAPDYGTMKIQVSDLTMNDYAQVQDLDLQLQTLIRDLVNKQVKLAEQQHLSPETTYSLVLHTLEAEIETIVTETLNGSRPKLQRYVLPLTNKLNKKQEQELKEYLNRLLSNSVANQLMTVYNIKAPNPQVVPEWYEAPEYGNVKVQVSDLTLNEYNQIKSLDVELQKHIKDLVDKQVKLLQNQHLSPDTIYTNVLHTLEAEIETLISDSFSGSQSDVERYVLPLKTLLNQKQQQELKEYLNSVLKESVEQQLIKVHKIETPKPQVIPSWYQAPKYDTIKDHVFDLTPNDYDQIKSLDIELQKQIRDLVDKEVKQLQNQHLTPDTIYTSVLYTLEAEIESLITESLSGSRPDVQRYAWPLKKKLNPRQQQQLKEYFNTLLQESITEQLTKVHNIEAPKPQVIPSWYQAPTYDIIKVQVSDLTLDDYDEIKSLDVELQKLIRDLVGKQVKLLQNQHQSPDTIYTSVLTTLEDEIESLITGSISGSKPEVQRYVLPLKRKLTPKQMQELQKYLNTILEESVTEQLTNVHKIEAPKPQVIPSWYQAPTYETIKIEVSDLTLDEYNQLKKLDVELQKLVRDLVEKQVKLVQHQQSPDTYNTVLHTLETEIETLIRETLRGSKPELQNYAGPLKDKLNKKQQQQIKQYFSNILNDSVEKQLVEVYHIEAPTSIYQVPSFESLQITIPDLTPEQYQPVKQLDIQLQKYINAIMDKHVKLAQEQHKTPQDAFVTVLHTLEDEIETTVRDALRGHVTELLPYTRPIKSKLNRKQIQRLNDYLNNALVESVTTQLGEIFITSSHQTPTFESLKKQIPNLSKPQFEIIKQLDAELQEYLSVLAQKQIKLAQDQAVVNEDTYTTVLHTLEEEIDRIIGGTLNGHRPELLKYHSLIKDKLNRSQTQPLREHLETILTSSVKRLLDNISYDETTIPTGTTKPSKPSIPFIPSNPTTPLEPSLPSVPPEPVHQIPTYESLQNQIPDLTVNQYETVKELDTELQDHINDLIQKQIKLAQQQHISPEDAYVTVLHTLEAEIESLVQGNFGSSKPEYKKYATLIKNNFNKAQHQQLKEYLSISLSQTVTQYLRRVYVNIVPQNILPIYATPEYESLQEEINDLTPTQYDKVKELNVNLQEYLNDIIQQQVQLVQKQNLPPEEAYKIILTTLESEIETLVPGTVQGNRPELQVFSNLVKHKLSNGQLQQLQDYLLITLKLTVKRHLLRIYNLTEQTTYIYKPQYKVIRVKLENITTTQFNIIKKLEAEFSQIVTDAIINEDLSEHGDMSSYDKYQVLSKKLESDLHKNITDFIMGTEEPGLSKYSELIDRNFERSKIPDVGKYLEIRLIKKIRDALTQKYNVDSFTSSGAVNSAYQYQTSKQVTTHYGNVQQINQDSEQTQKMKPIIYQHATVVNSHPQTHELSNSEVDYVEVFSPSSEQPEQTTEASGWWSSLGNKVKSIKQKIVG